MRTPTTSIAATHLMNMMRSFVIIEKTLRYFTRNINVIASIWLRFAYWNAEDMKGRLFSGRPVPACRRSVQMNEAAEAIPRR